MIMAENKFARLCARNMTAAAALALCLTASVAGAQTPAQDEGHITTDKQAISDAQDAVKKDTAQLAADTAAKNEAAIKVDTSNIDVDKLNQTAAETKLKSDLEQQISDNERFGIKAPPPPAPAATGSAAIDADKKAIADAQDAVKKDTAQLASDTTAGNAAAQKTDTDTLAADKQKESAAEDKLKADSQQSGGAAPGAAPGTPAAGAPAAAGSSWAAGGTPATGAPGK